MKITVYSIALNEAKLAERWADSAAAWALAPYDIGSVCANSAGLMDLSRQWLTKALAPDDRRINGNRKFIFPEEAQRKTGE